MFIHLLHVPKFLVTFASVRFGRSRCFLYSPYQEARTRLATAVTSTPQEGCIFCRIADGKVKPGGRRNPQDLLFESNCVVAFEDASPMSACHFLVIPKAHLKNCWSLTPQLLDEMEHASQEVLKARRLNVGSSTLVFFTRPPLNGVSHVHMHVLTTPFTHMSPWNPMHLVHATPFLQVTPAQLREQWKDEPPQNSN